MKDWGRKGEWRVANSEWRTRICHPHSLRAIRPLLKPKGSLPVVANEIRQGLGHMAEDTITTTGIARHGATRLPSVEVDSFNIELKDDEVFLGDRASKGAFRKILDSLRKPLRKNGDDPLGKKVCRRDSKGRTR